MIEIDIKEYIVFRKIPLFLIKPYITRKVVPPIIGEHINIANIGHIEKSL